MIINSRLDNDFYQFTMAQLIHENWHDMKVRYEFRNRTFSVPLGQRISLTQLKAEIEHVRQLKFTKAEINYLRGTGYFAQGFLNWLELTHELPPVQVWMENGHLKIEYEGDWQDAVFWETILLSLVSELYCQKYGILEAEGILRLHEKIRYLKQKGNLHFVEFGTRRRWSQEWQERVTSAMVNEFDGGQLLGTSNVLLAQTYGLYPVGTMAHQLFMVMAAGLTTDTSASLPTAQKIVMDAWGERYHEFPELMCLLPDTYGTKTLLDNYPTEDLQKWKAMRQDSGDPFEIGEYMIQKYNEGGVTRPVIVFSDGLDLRTMDLLYDRFNERAVVKFGWGTNLTNDLGFQSLSLVIKPKTANGYPCVKLSDNIAKATGDSGEIERYKKLAGYAVEYEKAAVY